MRAQPAGSREAARILLTALRDGRHDDVRSTLASLDWFVPEGSPASEFERREVLECMGEEAIRNSKAEARSVCFELLEHIAGNEPYRNQISQYLQ